MEFGLFESRDSGSKGKRGVKSGVGIKNKTLLEQCAVIFSILSFTLCIIIIRVSIYMQVAKKLVLQLAIWASCS